MDSMVISRRGRQVTDATGAGFSSTPGVVAASSGSDGTNRVAAVTVVMTVVGVTGTHGNIPVTGIGGGRNTADINQNIPAAVPVTTGRGGAGCPAGGGFVTAGAVNGQAVGSGGAGMGNVGAAGAVGYATVGNISVTHETGAGAGIVPAIGIIGGDLAVVTIGGGAGVGGGAVGGVGVGCAIPVFPGAVAEDIGKAVVQTGMIAISDFVTIAAHLTLLAVAAWQRVAEFGSKDGHVRGMPTVIVKVSHSIEGTVVGSNTLRPVFGHAVTVTVVTFATLEGRVAGVGVTTVTLRPRVVGVVNTIVIVSDFSVVMAGLADTVFTHLDVTGRIGAIIKVGDGLTTNQGFDHGVAVAAHVFAMRIMTDHTAVAVNTGAVGGMAVGEVSV